MDTFATINRNRAAHGYAQRNLKAYKRFCNKGFRNAGATPSPDRLLFKLESNTTKYQLFKSPRFLHKNLHLLKKSDGVFASVYKKYTECLLNTHRDALVMDELVELHHKLAEYYTFLEDIYTMADGQHDFDQYKIVHMWHDIELLFETTQMRDMFTEGTLDLADHRFNTQLAMKILSCENALKDFGAAIKSPDADVPTVCEVFERLHSLVIALAQFLDDNYLVSNYVKLFAVETSTVHRFLSSLAGFQTSAPAEEFIVPSLYSDYATDILALQRTGRINKSDIRRLLINTLERRLAPQDTQPVVPLLPVFYDIAYDYINYPPVDECIVEQLENTSFVENK